MSGNADRVWALVKAEAGYRVFFKKYLCDREGAIEVTEFPKSGGSWLATMLSEITGLPFPQNRFPRSRRCILHGHVIHSSRIKRKVVLWRDPRDVLVSWYHHCIIGNQNTNPRFVRQCRASFGVSEFEDVSSNMALFVQWCFSKPPAPGFSWVEFFDYWHPQTDICHVRYEDLRRGAGATLAQLVDELGYGVDRSCLAKVVEKHSFEAQTGRRPGEEDKNSFMRKGIVGDWRNFFDAEALENLDIYLGNRLQLLGYELH